MMNLPKLAIFDCDGVILDTAYIHFLAWKKLAKEEFDFKLDKKYLNIFRGVSRIECLREIFKLANINDFEEEYVENLLEKKNLNYLNYIGTGENINVYSQVIKFIKKLKSYNVLIALASSSKNSKTLLEITNLIHLFDYIVDPTIITKGKPYPDIFLAAADYFRINPKYCWGIEDAQVGVKSIKSANMFCIGIGMYEMIGEADYIFDKPENINLIEILQLTFK